MKLKLHVMPHKVLRKKCGKLEKFDSSTHELFKAMVELMSLDNGIGLAAPQAGMLQHFFVMKMPDEDNAEFFANTEVLSQDDNSIEIMEEGCLSIPGIVVKVERPTKIRVSYQDVNGKRVKKDLQGLKAVCFQHERDHTLGILIIDKIKNKIEREELSKIAIENGKYKILEQPENYK